MEFTQALLQNYGAAALLASALIVVLAGFVKGAVGFGMPMIMVAGLGSFLSAEAAVAGLLLPTLVTNTYQALRGGGVLAFDTLKKYWRFNLIFAVTIIFAAQLVVTMPEQVLFIILGVTICGFGLIQTLGVQLRFSPRRRTLVESLLGVASGLFGGMSGIWGPPLILYLLALNVPKIEQVRALGITFLLGSIILVSAHFRSGLLNPETTPFSAVLVLPAALGMFFGYRLQSRLDQALFQRLTLIVLVLAGANLLRRGLFG
jgi:uncharacterized protein